MNKSAIAVTLTSSSGTAEFSDVETGSYYIRVSGDAIETTDSDPVVLENGRNSISARVSVKKLEDTKPGAANHPGAPSVAVADLNVPPKAVKELESAHADMAQEHWDKALEHLNKAVAIYPQYSSAYNDLGVCYDRLGQKERQREALQKAVSVNERCVPALVNLAHMDVVDHQLPEADLLLKKAVTADPTNVDALTLQAEVGLQAGALPPGHCRRASGAWPPPRALCHRALHAPPVHFCRKTAFRMRLRNYRCFCRRSRTVRGLMPCARPCRVSEQQPR